jgi:hypothetical protein
MFGVAALLAYGRLLMYEALGASTTRCIKSLLHLKCLAGRRCWLMGALKQALDAVHEYERLLMRWVLLGGGKKVAADGARWWTGVGCAISHIRCNAEAR